MKFLMLGKDSEDLATSKKDRKACCYSTYLRIGCFNLLCRICFDEPNSFSQMIFYYYYDFMYILMLCSSNVNHKVLLFTENVHHIKKKSNIYSGVKMVLNSDDT